MTVVTWNHQWLCIVKQTMYFTFIFLFSVDRTLSGLIRFTVPNQNYYVVSFYRFGLGNCTIIFLHVNSDHPGLHKIRYSIIDSEIDTGYFQASQDIMNIKYFYYHNIWTNRKDAIVMQVAHLANYNM